MAERLAQGKTAVALLGNTLATVWGLFVLIEVFGLVSGAHFNPAVSTVMAFRGALPWSQLLPYWLAQLFGAACGTWLTHAMFDMEILQWSTKVRVGNGHGSPKWWPPQGCYWSSCVLPLIRSPRS